MTIGINGQKLLIKEPAGPEVYTYNVVRALAKLDKKNSYIVYFDENPPKNYFENLSFGNKNFSYKVIGIICFFLYFLIFL